MPISISQPEFQRDFQRYTQPYPSSDVAALKTGQGRDKSSTDLILGPDCHFGEDIPNGWSITQRLGYWSPLSDDRVLSQEWHDRVPSHVPSQTSA